MSSSAKLAANLANAQLSTGPRTEEGKAASSKNAIKSGLFSAGDFIRPGEEPLYTELDESLRADLAPSGQLEHNLVDEIRRVMWRLRRCGQVEAGFIGSAPTADIPDPMQNEATARLQLSVDRARSQCHRLLHKCTAELRKLQTERQVRNECFEAGTDLTGFGLCEVRSLGKAVDEQTSARLRQNKLDEMENSSVFEDNLSRAAAIPVDALPFAPGEKPVAKQTQTPRNARCTCGSGQKYKRCCGRGAAPLLHTA